MIIYHNYNSKEEVQRKLDVFYASNRITEEQYTELMELLIEQE